MSLSGGKVLLVDGHSLAYRAFYGYNVDNFTTSTGQHTNAVYGFVTLFLSAVRSEKPTHIGVAFDRSRITFRTKAYADYKATRSATPDEFKGQVTLIKDVLDALGVVWVEVEDYEADDIIATWTRQARMADFEVSISTGDRDSFQLIEPQVTVLYPGRDSVQRMTPEAVETKYGVSPARYPELAALVGETSDNLPGVPGVGPKTAAKWLVEYDGLENLIRRAAQVPGKTGESFRAHLEDVQRNRRLNALVRDLVLPVSATGLSPRAPDMIVVESLFDALEFGAIRDRVHQVFAPPPTTVDPPATIDAVEVAPGDLTAWLAEHGSAPAGLAIQTRRVPGGVDIATIGIASPDGVTGCLDVTGLTNEDDAALGTWLEDETVPKTVHGLKESLAGAWARGWDIGAVVCDTQLAAYLANPDRRSFDLPTLSQRYLHRELDSTIRGVDDQPAFDFEPQQASTRRVGIDARTIADLAGPLTSDLVSKGATTLLTDVEIPLARVLARMESIGIAVDPQFFDGLRRQFDERVRQAQGQAFAVIGHEINLSSPKQLQTVLFDELGMPKTRRTKSGKTGYTTDAEALEWLYATTENPFLEHLLAHRDAIKLRQTVEGLMRAVGEDDRIHTTYLQTVAATGRLSSQDPNLQNIPTRTPAGNQIREGFVAGDGFESLMTADYSQIEMRIMAHVCADQLLIDAFRSGQDFHTVMAAHIFGLNPDDVTPADRSRVKAVNYGLAYGLSAYGLASQLKIPVHEASQLMDEYFSRFGPVRDYLNSLVAQARKTGYTQTLLGRRRYLPDLTSPNRTLREMAERAALNAPIQGSAADIIKLAMLQVARRLEDGFRSRLLLQVHDELVLEVAPGERARLEAMVRHEMSEAIQLDVPLEVSVGVGPTWATAAH